MTRATSSLRISGTINAAFRTLWSSSCSLTLMLLTEGIDAAICCMAHQEAAKPASSGQALPQTTLRRVECCIACTCQLKLALVPESAVVHPEGAHYPLSLSADCSVIAGVLKFNIC